MKDFVKFSVWCVLMSPAVLCVTAWVVHIVVCISDDRTFLLVLGILAFPIGIIHGLSVIFGV